MVLGDDDREVSLHHLLLIMMRKDLAKSLLPFPSLPSELDRKKEFSGSCDFQCYVVVANVRKVTGCWHEFYPGNI